MFWITCLVIISIFFYYFLYKPQLYWYYKHVKQGPPIPLFGDNLRLILKQESVKDMVINMYSRFKDDRYCGIYQTLIPSLLIRDPDLIRQLAVRDFDHFVDHRSITPPKVDPLWGHNLFALTGDDWKEMRATLSPTFTSSKMRAMFLLVENSAKQYVNYYLQQKKDILQIDLKDSFCRFANDVILNCAFGMTVDSLKEPNNEFYVNGRDATNLSRLSTNAIYILNTISFKFTKIFNLKLFPKKSTDFFQQLSINILKYREENNIVRPDVVHLLMQARKGCLKFDDSNRVQDAGFAAVEESDYGKIASPKKLKFTDTEIAAQMFVFLLGGLETTSSMMSFLCYEIAVHPEVQSKLHQEVDDVFKQNNGQLSYDILNNMKYLDMIVSESLRMHPPGPLMDRICTKEYTIQPELPGEKPVHLKPGDNLFFPTIAIHYDEKYFPEPEKFWPERFSNENKDLIKPYTYLPFGTGPRNCIGSRFVLMEVKTLACHILRRFELIVIDKTTVPLKYEKGKITMTIEDGFWVGFKVRDINA